MRRIVAFLLIGLVAQILVAAAVPCCCLRAAAAASSQSTKTSTSHCGCCARGGPRKRGFPTSHRDCNCKPGAVAPAERAPETAVDSLDVATPAFELAFVAWAPRLVIPAIRAVGDAGPPRAPSSASPALLPVLRV